MSLIFSSKCRAYTEKEVFFFLSRPTGTFARGMHERNLMYRWLFKQVALAIDISSYSNALYYLWKMTDCLSYPKIFLKLLKLICSKNTNLMINVSKLSFAILLLANLLVHVMNKLFYFSRLPSSHSEMRFLGIKSSCWGEATRNYSIWQRNLWDKYKPKELCVKNWKLVARQRSYEKAGALLNDFWTRFNLKLFKLDD